MNSFYMVAVQWNDTTVHPPLVDGVLGLYGEWMRFNPATWIVFSSKSSREISDHVARVLAPNDHVLVSKIDLSDYWGQAPTWIWVWIQERVQRTIPSFPPPAPPPPR